MTTVIPRRHPNAPPDSGFFYFTPDKPYRAYTKRGEFGWHVTDDLGRERCIAWGGRSPHLWPNPASTLSCNRMRDAVDWAIAGSFEKTD